LKKQSDADLQSSGLFLGSEPIENIRYRTASGDRPGKKLGDTGDDSDKGDDDSDKGDDDATDSDSSDSDTTDRKGTDSRDSDGKD
jgi:hypothetical protein